MIKNFNHLHHKLKFMILISMLLTTRSFGKNYFTGVYYYPWYDTNRHWQDGYLRGVLTTVQPPLLGEYSCRNQTTIQQQISWSLNNGIDYWVISWWGSGSWEDVTIRNYIAPALQGSALQFCIFYESTGLLGGPPINFDQQLINQFVSHFEYIATNYFNHPNYLKFLNRPVVFIYLTRTFTGSYVEAIDSLRARMLQMGYDIFLVGDEVYWGTPNTTRIACFDAITSYNMHGPSQYAGYPQNTGFFRDVNAKYLTYYQTAHNLGVYFIPDALPGFNDRAVRPEANHYAIPNQFGPGWDYMSTLRRSLISTKIFEEPALGNPIMITSWNEWHEDTQVEPTIVTGPCNTDTSQTGNFYTQGYTYVGYGLNYLKTIDWVVGNYEDTLFYTGFEPAHPHPFADSVFEIANVDGYGNAPQPEAGIVGQELGVPVPSGQYYLRIAGEDISSSQNSYCYYLLFNLNPDILIDSATFLTYHIYCYQKTHIAIDFITTDGTHLRNSMCIDQNEISVHPEQRTNPTGSWHFIEIDLYPLAGKMIDRLTIGYDDNPNSETGNYRDYIDEIAIITKKNNQVGITEEIKNPVESKNTFTISPNPASSFLLIKNLNEASLILDVYDISGRHLKNLLLYPSSTALWDLKDKNGKILSSGIYFLVNRNLPARDFKRVVVINE